MSFHPRNWGELHYFSQSQSLTFFPSVQHLSAWRRSWFESGVLASQLLETVRLDSELLPLRVSPFKLLGHVPHMSLSNANYCGTL